MRLDIMVLKKKIVKNIKQAPTLVVMEKPNTTEPLLQIK